jgi:hypothetical protein
MVLDLGGDADVHGGRSAAIEGAGATRILGVGHILQQGAVAISACNPISMPQRMT